MKTRVAVVEEDPLAREKLLRLLRNEPDTEIVGVWDWSGQAAAPLPPVHADVVFLTLETPLAGCPGVLDVLESSPAPVVVFMTTYDPPLICALEANGLEYLMKPFDAERLGRALRRARARMGPTGDRAHCLRVPAVLDRLAG